MQSQPPPPHQWGSQPPAGYPSPGYPPHSRPPQPPKKGMPTWAIIILVLAGGFFFLAGPLAVMTIYGVRKYIANAKTAEARNALGQIAKASVVAFEGDGEGGGGRVCPSASRPVPASAESIRGTKYQSSPDEWRFDANRRAGFACLRFEMTSPQYFQYDYHGGPGLPGNGFLAEAHGDLDGDGQLSTFSLVGQVDPTNDTLRVSPSILETDSQE